MSVMTFCSDEIASQTGNRFCIKPLRLMTVPPFDVFSELAIPCRVGVHKKPWTSFSIRSKLKTFFESSVRCMGDFQLFVDWILDPKLLCKVGFVAEGTVCLPFLFETLCWE
jgi:hypothetical protein